MYPINRIGGHKKVFPFKKTLISGDDFVEGRLVLPGDHQGEAELGMEMAKLYVERGEKKAVVRRARGIFKGRELEKFV